MIGKMKSAIIVLLAATIMSSVHAQTTPTFGPSTDYPLNDAEKCLSVGLIKFTNDQLSSDISFSVAATKTVLTTGNNTGKIQYDITSVTLSACPTLETDFEVVNPLVTHSFGGVILYYKLELPPPATSEECTLNVIDTYVKEDSSCNSGCNLVSAVSPNDKFIASVSEEHIFNFGAMYVDDNPNDYYGHANSDYGKLLSHWSACLFKQEISAGECGMNYYANADTTNLCTGCSTECANDFSTQSACTSTSDLCCPDGQYIVVGTCTPAAETCQGITDATCIAAGFIRVPTAKETEGTSYLKGPIIAGNVAGSSITQTDKCCGLVAGTVFHSIHDINRMKNPDACPNELDVSFNNQIYVQAQDVKDAFQEATGCEYDE